MRHATGLAILVLAGSLAGCCGPRWPTQAALPPAQRAIRYVAQAVKLASDRCVEEAGTNVEELTACDAVWDALKPTLIGLEKKP